MELSKDAIAAISWELRYGDIERFVLHAIHLGHIEHTNNSVERYAILCEIRDLFKNSRYAGSMVIARMEQNPRLSYREALSRIYVDALIRGLIIN